MSFLQGLIGPPDVGKLKAERDVKGLITALANRKDWSVRVRAAEALGELRAGEAVEPLIVALKDIDRDVRSAAARALGQLDDAWAVKPLIAALMDRDESVRQAAFEALVKLDARAVEPLIASLKDHDREVRGAAVEALGLLGDARAVQPLIAALTDSNGPVRLVVVEALVKLGDTRAVEPLLAALKDSDWEVRGAAAKTLGLLGDARAGEPLIAALTDSDASVRKVVARALGQIGDARAVEPLLAALKDSIESVRRAASEALGALVWQPAGETGSRYWIALRQWEKCTAMGSAAVGPLLAVLKDSDREVRRDAARALGQIGDARAIEPLIAALEDSDWEVRTAAAEGLGKLGWQPVGAAGSRYWIALKQWEKAVAMGPAAVEPLIASLNDSWGAARRLAARALGQIGATRAVEPLIAALEDSEQDMREVAAWALGQLGDARAVKPLLLLVAFKDSVAAAEALVRLGTAAVEPLLAAVNNERERDQVVVAAASALGHLGDARAVRPLLVLRGRSIANAEPVAARALVEIGTAAVEPLLAALKDKERYVRYGAADALAKLGWQPVGEAGSRYWIALNQWEKALAMGSAAVEPLLDAIKESDWEVRSAAVKALETLGWRPVGEAGSRYWIALGQWDKCVAIGSAAVEPLLVALNDSKESVRTAAAEGLGKLGWQPVGEAGSQYWIVLRKWEKCVAMGSVAAEPLLTVLKDSNESVRGAAAEALGQIGDARAVEPLIAALEDSDSKVRQAAANALVCMYKSGQLDATCQRLILVQRPTITTRHMDQPYGGPHVDWGTKTVLTIVVIRMGTLISIVA